MLSLNIKYLFCINLGSPLALTPLQFTVSRHSLAWQYALGDALPAATQNDTADCSSILQSSTNQAIPNHLKLCAYSTPGSSQIPHTVLTFPNCSLQIVFLEPNFHQSQPAWSMTGNDESCSPQVEGIRHREGSCHISLLLQILAMFLYLPALCHMELWEIFPYNTQYLSSH